MQHVVADVGLRRKRFHHGLSRCLDSERRPAFGGLSQGRGDQERWMRRHPMAPVNVVRISVATSGTDFTAPEADFAALIRAAESEGFGSGGRAIAYGVFICVMTKAGQAFHFSLF